MRKKLRELFSKEEGFTLVELLAVLVILGIIVAFAVPSVGNIIASSKDKALDAQVELVEDAARLYDVENDLADSTTLGALIDGGFLEEDILENEELKGNLNNSWFF